VGPFLGMLILWNVEVFMLAIGISEHMEVARRGWVMSTFDKMNVKNTVFTNFR
jgi:hypothetical protein